MMIGSGTPNSQSNAPLPKPMKASCQIAIETSIRVVSSSARYDCSIRACGGRTTLTLLVLCKKLRLQPEPLAQFVWSPPHFPVQR